MAESAKELGSLNEGLPITWWREVGLQEGVSPLIEQLVYFHDHIIIILILIITIVSYVILIMLFRGFVNRLLLERQAIEMI
jgi:cytochrome c oxidase subunit 2